MSEDLDLVRRPVHPSATMMIRERKEKATTSTTYSYVRAPFPPLLDLSLDRLQPDQIRGAMGVKT